MNSNGNGSVNNGAAKSPEGRFFCSAERHLYQMKSSLACPLYSWGRRLSTTSGVFSASAQHVATYFGVDRKTALSALEELADLGFFVIDRSERGKPNTYKVVDHDEWAKRNPGRCVGKVSFPWQGQGDPLGRELYAISGRRVKLWPRQATGLRNLGFSDQQIIEQFRIFIDAANYRGKRWKHAYFDFHTHLKGLVVAKTRSNESSRTDRGVVQSNGHPPVQSNGLHQSSRTDSSSRISSREAIGESESSIPAPRRQAVPSFTNKSKEEKPFAELSDEEVEARRRLLKEQAAMITANGNGAAHA